MNSGLMPMFAPVLMKVGKTFIERMFGAIINSVLNKKSESEMLIDVLHDTIRRNDEFNREVHAAQMTDKAWLQDMVGVLAAKHRPAIRTIPEPIGRSVREMQIGKDDVGPSLDEAEAEVLRARQPMEVGDLATYTVTVEGVFKTNGACKLRILDGGDEVVSGKITDPALDHAPNIYTTALNEGLPLQVSAKPTLKNGRVHTLYVSDGKLLGR
jgi:hypothetical protein